MSLLFNVLIPCDCDLQSVVLGIQFYLIYLFRRSQLPLSDTEQCLQTCHVCRFDTSYLDRFTQQTPNHMPRLDCPSVSAETFVDETWFRCR